MSDFRNELLSMLGDDFDITPKTVAEGFAQVIRGETVVEKHVVAKDSGDLELRERRVSKNPQDIMFGAMVFDSLRGGDLGIAPAHMKSSKGTKPGEIVHRRFAIDREVVANSSEASARRNGELVRSGDYTLDEIINIEIDKE